MRPLVRAPGSTLQIDAPSPADGSRSRGSMVIGAICGLAWSASLRGWMIQIAGDESTFSWAGTFALILLPGALLGASLGWAEHLRRTGALRGVRQQWLVASPLLLAAALLDPEIFRALITTGLGGGALGVVCIGLAGGYALSRRGSLVARIASGLVALVLMVACASIATENAPLTTAHGAWIAVQITSLLVVFCVACSIPHRTSGRYQRPDAPVHPVVPQ